MFPYLLLIIRTNLRKCAQGQKRVSRYLRGVGNYTSHKNKWNSYRPAHKDLVKRVPLKSPIHYYYTFIVHLYSDLHCCTVKVHYCASRPNFATFGLFVTDVLWELHINCQNVKIIGQANGTLKIFKLLPWLPGLP